jgi:hypothetical protein
MYIAIDPGADGGIAWRYGPNTRAIKMPPSLDTLKDFFEADDIPGEVVLENVGGYRPGNSGPAACKFAKHVGQLEGLLYGMDYRVIKVPPRTWMKALGTWSKDKETRKREIKEAMQKKYPHIKVTLALSDALGILTWAEEHMKK